jgi:hypothetical protein
MNGAQLVDRYLKGRPLSRDERSALARQLGSATKAAQAISMARVEAASACLDWQPVEPREGWVAWARIKRVMVIRVYHNGDIVKAFQKADEHEAAQFARKLAIQHNANYLGCIADPDAAENEAERRQLAGA